jgi:hypothetical protein
VIDNGTVADLNIPVNSGQTLPLSQSGLRRGIMRDANGRYILTQTIPNNLFVNPPTTNALTQVRAYFRTDNCSVCQDRCNGALIQGSNDNANWTTLATLPRPNPGWNEHSISNSTAYAYVRYVAAGGCYGELMEVEFYAGSTKLTGTAIGGGQPNQYPGGNDGWAKALDGNLGTFWHGASPGSHNWAGLQVGTPPPPGCDFTPSVSASTESPGCGGSVQLTAGCTGADCNGLSYSWSNSGGSNATASYTLPNSNGTHTYTLTMSRSGCSNKTADKSFTLSGCTTTDPTNCIEAETSTTSMDIQNSGQASGGQFVGNFGEASAYANFAVNVASGGDKTITLTYAAAGGSKQVRVQVNDGAEQTLTLASTGGWESFATQTISVNLPTGSSTLKFKGVADNYWRLDKLCLPGTPPPVGNCYEGESLGGGQNDPNASGGQFIGFGNQFEGRDYSVNATGTLRITYASGEGCTIGVKIGSGSVQTVTLGATPSWSSYQTVNTNISVSGATTVRIQGGSGYVRLDRFCISSGARQAAPEPNVAEADGLHLRIVPNPSNGRFVARFGTVAGQAYTLTLTDAAGRSVRAAQTIVGTGQEHAEVIQLPAQVRGMLLLQVSSGSQRSSRKVLIE